jgi:NAD(P)-dependent dehydrogenase (short-subunit alcohol dehydrogenase family)
LGRALAEEFIRRGHPVAGCARGAAAIARLNHAFGAPHDFAVCDLADETAVADWAAGVRSRFGVPDLLVNNAALINRNAPLWEVPAEEFERVVDVNLNGTVRVIRHFLPAMLARGRGVVVNFSSGWGRSTAPEVAPYCATKWAVEGLTQALAAELPRGLAAVPVNPGIIHTDMLESCFGPDAASFPPPAEWARRAVPFLLNLGPADNGRPCSVA